MNKKKVILCGLLFCLFVFIGCGDNSEKLVIDTRLSEMEEAKRIALKFFSVLEISDNDTYISIKNSLSPYLSDELVDEIFSLETYPGKDMSALKPIFQRVGVKKDNETFICRVVYKLDTRLGEMYKITYLEIKHRKIYKVYTV